MTSSTYLQNRYSLAVFILWQQIGEDLPPCHLIFRPLLTSGQPSNGWDIRKR